MRGWKRTFKKHLNSLYRLVMSCRFPLTFNLWISCFNLLISSSRLLMVSFSCCISWCSDKDWNSLWYGCSVKLSEIDRFLVSSLWWPNRTREVLRICWMMFRINLIAWERQQMVNVIFNLTRSFVLESLRMGLILDDFFKMLETFPIGPSIPDSF